MAPCKSINLTFLPQIAQVSRTDIKTFGEGKGDVRILAVDCGMKNSILRCLVKRGAVVTVVPWDYDFATALDDYDALFLSNGKTHTHTHIYTHDHTYMHNHTHNHTRRHTVTLTHTHGHTHTHTHTLIHLHIHTHRTG
jgi:hypothetical protein